jgi:hypothetical protein
MPKKGKYSLKQKARRIALYEGIPYSAALARLTENAAEQHEGPQGRSALFPTVLPKPLAEVTGAKYGPPKSLAELAATKYGLPKSPYGEAFGAQMAKSMGLQKALGAQMAMRFSTEVQQPE